MHNRMTFLRRTWRGLGPALTFAILLCAPVTASPHRHRPLHPSQVPRGAGKSPVSLNVDRAPIKAVLHLIFRQANQSYVLGSHVRGTVTASFRRIPFDRALKVILSANSVPLTKTILNGVYVIRGPRTARSQTAYRQPAVQQPLFPRTTTPRQINRRRPIHSPHIYRRPSHYRRQYGRPYTVPNTGSVIRIIR